MKIEKITPVVIGTLMIVLLALATSCSTMQTTNKFNVVKKYNSKNVAHNHSCYAYH